MLSPKQADELADALLSQARAQRARRPGVDRRHARRHPIPIGMLAGIYAGATCGLWIGRHESALVCIGMLGGGVFGFFWERRKKRAQPARSRGAPPQIDGQ